MRTIIRATAFAVAALLVASADARAQVWGRAATPQNGVCFYENVNYGGSYFCTNANAADRLIEMNDRISSIRVFGNAEVTVYQNRDFEGRSRTFASDVSNLSRDGWNDTITSIRVQPAAASANRWGRPAVPANGACFYENVDFTGQYFCSRQGESIEMVPAGTNDRISSIRLFGNAALVVYRDRDFAGVAQWFDASEPDLRESGWNDTISSYRVDTRGAVGNRGRGYGYGRGSGRPYGDVEQATGSMEWRGRVDERVQLVIRGRAVQARTLSGTSFDDGRAAFSSGLPAQPVRVTVTGLAGRGEVRVIQQPSRQNGYTAIVEIDDPMRGAQEHRLQLSWR